MTTPRLLVWSAVALMLAVAIASHTARADEAPASAIVEAPADAGPDAAVTANLHLDDGIFRLDGATEAGLAKQTEDSGCAVGSPARDRRSPLGMIGLTVLALLVVTKRRVTARGRRGSRP